MDTLSQINPLKLNWCLLECGCVCVCARALFEIKISVIGGLKQHKAKTISQLNKNNCYRCVHVFTRRLIFFSRWFFPVVSMFLVCRCFYCVFFFFDFDSSRPCFANIMHNVVQYVRRMRYIKIISCWLTFMPSSIIIGHDRPT